MNYRINSKVSQKGTFYEPIQHRVNRNFYESNVLRSDENTSFNFQTKKDILIAKNKQKQHDSSSKNRNSDPPVFDTNKLMMDPEGYRSTNVVLGNIQNTLNMHPQGVKNDDMSFNQHQNHTKKVQKDPEIKISPKKHKILNMILNNDQDRVKTSKIPVNKELPISILKNRIRPVDPSYPEKCLTGYDNLKQDMMSRSTSDLRT